MNLNQVTLPARNVAESVSFYRRLGLEQIVDTAHYARFVCPDGDATFSIHETARPISGEGAIVYFEHRDLDALCERLKREGVKFLQMPTDERWLWREARLLDPSGNTICLYWAGEYRTNPPWRIK